MLFITYFFVPSKLAPSRVSELEIETEVVEEPGTAHGREGRGLVAAGIFTVIYLGLILASLLPEGGALRGEGGQIVPKSSHRAHLARLIVAPAWRGRGLGTGLVKALLAQARSDGHLRASLNVSPANPVAIHVYEKLGFSDAPRPLDEPDPSGSRYMERPL